MGEEQGQLSKFQEPTLDRGVFDVIADVPRRVEGRGFPGVSLRRSMYRKGASRQIGRS